MSLSQAQIDEVDGGRYRVIGCLDFVTVPQLLRVSNKLFSGKSELHIDLAAVTQSNSAGLALLLEWLRWARQGSQAIRFSDIPASIQTIAGASDLQELLSSSSS